MKEATNISALSETGARIVEAAARLLDEHGPSAVTTRAVAEDAGVQSPTIYRLFGDKAGLLDAVAEHVMATYVSTKGLVVETAAVDNVDPLEDLRAGWEKQIDFGVENSAVFGLLSDPARVRRSPAAQSGLRILRTRVHRIAAAGQLRVSEQRAVDIIHAAGTGTILTILQTPPEQRDLRLADSMYEAVLRQILLDVPELAQRQTIATVVALRAITPELGMLTEAERGLLAQWLDRAIETLDDPTPAAVPIVRP